MGAAADAELDAMLEESEREILMGHRGTASCRNLIGGVAPIVSRLCKNLTLLKQVMTSPTHTLIFPTKPQGSGFELTSESPSLQYPHLRTSALLTLSKLMAIDLHFW